MSLSSLRKKKLGDAVADVANALGIPTCPPCARRQAALNAWDEEVRRRAREALERLRNATK